MKRKIISVLVGISVYFFIAGFASATYFYTLESEAVITGIIGVGTTSPDAVFNVQGGTDVALSTSYPGFIVAGDLQGYNIGIDNNEIMARNNGSAANLYLQIDGGGLYLLDTWWSSDGRLKKNVITLDESLDKISKLRGVSYNWIDKDRDKSKKMGLIAQEVEKVFPDLVETDDHGNKAVAYIDLIAPIIEAVKELKAENDELYSLIDELEYRIAELEMNN